MKQQGREQKKGHEQQECFCLFYLYAQFADTKWRSVSLMEEIIWFKYMKEKVAETLLGVRTYCPCEPGLSQLDRKRFLLFSPKIFELHQKENEWVSESSEGIYA